jgi:hypothetical protein
MAEREGRQVSREVDSAESMKAGHIPWYGWLISFTLLAGFATWVANSDDQSLLVTAFVVGSLLASFVVRRTRRSR